MHTGRKADHEKFEVLTLLPSHLALSPHDDSTFPRQIYKGCIRLAETVLAETPQLQIMRDPPSLLGKRVRYAMVFHFEEEGEARQSCLRARSRELPTSLEAWRGRPAGWEAVYAMIQTIFGAVDEEVEEIVIVLPADALVTR